MARTISDILAEIDKAKEKREDARVLDDEEGMEEVRDHLHKLRVNLEYAIREPAPFDQPTDSELFYSINKDRITQVVCALIMDPDTSRARLDNSDLVDCAAEIVSEIARRAGDTAVLPGKGTGEATGQQFDAMA